MIRSLEIGHKSGKSQGILKWKMSGNPEICCMDISLDADVSHTIFRLL